MKHFVYAFIILFLISTKYTTSYASVSYSNHITSVNSNVPVEKKKNKTKNNKNKTKKNLKKAPPKVQSPRVGKVFLILGIIFFGLFLIATILLILLFQYWVMFVALMAVLLFVGIWFVIMGSIFKGRNKDWDIDYR